MLITSVSTLVAVLADKVCDVLVFSMNNFTVCAIRSALVFKI